MRRCCLCFKIVTRENGTFFGIPKDEQKRKKWSEICRMQFTSNSRICADHFSSSDIIQRARKVSLMPNAVPFVELVNGNCPAQLADDNIKLEKNCDTDLVLDTSIQYVQNNTSGASNQKCRCCSNPTANFIKLDVFIQTSEETEKTYKDLLYEITKLNLATYQEINMPQQICEKCEAQLKSSYKFIQQACKVSQQYLEILVQENLQEDIKNIELLQESLMEISSPIAEQVQEVKDEPLNIVCNIDIKEEKVESEVFVPMISNNEESQEERYILQNSNIDDNSSDDEDSDEPVSVKDFDIEVNNRTLVRCCEICHNVYRNEKLLKIHKHYTYMPDEDKLPYPWVEYKRDAQKRGIPKQKIQRFIHFKMGTEKIMAKYKRAIEIEKDQLDFHEVEENLVGNVNPIQTLKKIRQDKYDHWPEVVKGAPLKCRNSDCKGRSRTRCSKCKSHFCLTKDKNCFKEFHLN